MNKEPYYDSLPQDAKDWLDEHEEEINQDHIAQREITIGLPVIKKTVELPEAHFFTKMQRKILALFGQGLDRADVCQVLGINRKALRWHIIQLKKKTSDSDI